MQGKLWIDKDSFQWVKVEAQVMHPASIEGFLAKVEPGIHFELEKEPVGTGIWLPKHFAMRSRAKILFVISHQGQEDASFFSYRKITQSAPSRSNSKFESICGLMIRAGQLIWVMPAVLSHVSCAKTQPEEVTISSEIFRLGRLRIVFYS